MKVIAIYMCDAHSNNSSIIAPHVIATAALIKTQGCSISFSLLISQQHVTRCISRLDTKHHM